MNKPMLSIGVPQATVQIARNTILDIIKSDNGQSVKLQALKTLATVCNVNNAIVSHNVFTNNPARKLSLKK